MLNTEELVEGEQGNRLVQWAHLQVNRHPLALFFALTFLLTWTIFGVVAAVPFENSKTAHLIINIGGFGPSISAILLATIANSGAGNQSSKDRFVVFFPVLILVAGVEALDHIYWGHPIDSSVILADAILVTLCSSW